MPFSRLPFITKMYRRSLWRWYIDASFCQLEHASSATASKSSMAPPASRSIYRQPARYR
jgi:hypothetical protein